MLPALWLIGVVTQLLLFEVELRGILGIFVPLVGANASNLVIFIGGLG